MYSRGFILPSRLTVATVYQKSFTECDSNTFPSDDAPLRDVVKIYHIKILVCLILRFFASSIANGPEFT